MAIAFELPQPEWPELKLARRTYPMLTVQDQETWLGLERVSYYPGFMHGYFTFRVVSNKFGPNIEGHLARGKTHVLAPMVARKAHGGEDMIVTMFLVDLRKALLRKDLAELRRNRQLEEYLLFESVTPGVDLIAEKLKTS